MTETTYWIWLQQLFGFGTRRVAALMDYFEHPRAIYDGIAAGGPAVAMLSAEELYSSELCMRRAVEIEHRTLRKGCDILTPDHPDYPALLLGLPDRPAALYAKGDLACLHGSLAVAMVGTRTHTDYGRRAAELLAGDLARGGAVVVSGLAYGIDTECHRAALAAGGKSVGVLGCGLDINYPADNAPLKTAMRQNGAVITEYPLGTQPVVGNFPQRNRIISGMCQATVVVEADLRSGSLITARLARKQKRDVFAVPSSIFEEGGQGTNTLLKDGARPANSAQDIFALYDWHSRKESGAPAQAAERVSEKPAPPELPEALTQEARAVYGQFGSEKLTVDDLAGRTALCAAAILTALTELEIFSLIQSYPGRRFGLL